MVSARSRRRYGPACERFRGHASMRGFRYSEGHGDRVANGRSGDASRARNWRYIVSALFVKEKNEIRVWSLTITSLPTFLGWNLNPSGPPIFRRIAGLHNTAMGPRLSARDGLCISRRISSCECQLINQYSVVLLIDLSWSQNVFTVGEELSKFPCASIYCQEVDH